MGKKRVKWKNLKNPNLSSSCDKCDSIGIIQDYIYGYGIRYIYCDCYFGKKAKEEHENHRTGTHLRT